MASTGAPLNEFPIAARNGNQLGERQGDASKQFHLSQEEIRALQECNRESFYYRCLPICASAMIATHYAVSLGYLRRSANYGSLFKVIGAGVIGYFVGKFSYRSACEDKLMQLPHSQLAEAIRRRRQGFRGFPENRDFSDNLLTDSTRDANVQDHIVGLGGQGTWEINSGDNVDFQGMDDLHRPSVDNPVILSDEDKASQSESTYETLRKQNRDDYEARHTRIVGVDQQRIASSGGSIGNGGQISRAPMSSRTRASGTADSSGIRNKYGDLVD